MSDHRRVSSSGPRPRPTARPIPQHSYPEGRRLWDIGSWGGASDHIGKRWEYLGFLALKERVARDSSLWLSENPPKIISFVEPDLTPDGDTDNVSTVRLTGLGLTSPDAIIVDPSTDFKSESGADVTLIRSVDFKWSLDTASWRQISAEAFYELWQHPNSPLPEALYDLVGMPRTDEPLAADGFFLAPDSRPNRDFLFSEYNRRQEYPIDPGEVLLIEITGEEFYEPLPWWSLAIRLSQLDRMESLLASLDGAERYYRLGAGAGGAYSKSRTSIFAEKPPELDVEGGMEEIIKSARSRTSLELLEYLRLGLDAREARAERLSELTRLPYGWKEYLSDLSRLGINVPDNADAKTPVLRSVRDRFGKLHKSIARAFKESVLVMGRELTDKGANDTEALLALERERGDLMSKARVIAHRAIRQELAGG